MPSISEGNITFTFPTAWTAEKYDQLRFYTKEFQHVVQAKAADIVAIEPRVCC